MRFWNTLSLIGVLSHYDDKLVKRITLTNQFGFIAMVIFFFTGINNYFLGDIFSAIILESFTLLSLCVFWLNKNHFHKLCTSVRLIICSIAVFYFDSYSGVPSGAYLFHFPLILAIAFLFDYKEKQLVFFHFSLPLILLLINTFTYRNLFENELLTESDIEKMFLFNLIFSVASIGFFMFLTISNNLKASIVFEQRINERKLAEHAIKLALNEKNILLAEIHHRVKNNLAIIVGLFNLQMNTIENEEAKSILQDSKNRVKSMALIHDSLYGSASMSNIDFAKYTKELISEIQYSYSTISTTISVKTTISDITLTLNNAIPCGLILNELLTNCYKHAFDGREKGSIEISFSKEKKGLQLKVKDDGVGLKADYCDTDSLGIVLINSLSEQLDGKCKFTVDNGTCFVLDFG